MISPSSRTTLYWLAVGVLLSLGAMACGGCSEWLAKPRAALQMPWVASEMTQLTDRTARFDDPLILDGQKRVSLLGAGNETVSFQLIVDSPPEGIAALQLVCSGLRGPASAIASESVQIFRMLPIAVKEYPASYLRLIDGPAQGSSYYDPLVPVSAPAGGSTASSPPSGQPFNIAPLQRMAFWVDIAIPRTAGPGTYAGTISLRSNSHGPVEMPISLQVCGFVLPDARPLAAVGAFDHQTIFRTFVQRDGKPYEPARLDRANPQVHQGLTVMRQLMVMAHEHRLDLLDRTMHPTLRREASGKVNLDWEDYDNVAVPYLSGSAFEDRTGCPAWVAPWSDTWPNPANYGGVHSDEYVSVTSELLTQCQQHFRQLGAADQVFLWPYRQEIGPAGYAIHSAMARIARSADSQAPIMSQLPPSLPSEALWKAPDDFAGLVDIFAPPAQWLDVSLGDHLAKPARPLRGVWLSPGLPPYLPSMDIWASPAGVRAIPWFAMRYHAAGLFFDEVLNWEGDIFSSPAGAATRLFYPGKAVGIAGVLPSVRLKRLRRGLTDLSYIQLLQQRQRPAIAESIARSLARYAGLAATGDNYLDVRLHGWVEDGTMWHKAHRLLAEEVQASVHPDEPPGAALVAQRVTWKDFDEQTHTIRVEQVRSFVQPAKNHRLTTTVLLDLYNEYNRNADVLVKLEDLPTGWTGLVAEQHLGTMAPGSRRTVELTAEGAYIPAGGNGKMPVAISITTDMQRRQSITASAAFLLAGAATKPPRIDGSLDDWPIRGGDAAGEFKCVGRRGEIGQGLAVRQTTAFAMYDNQNLYIAFRCDEPSPAGMIARPSNIIQYQQLLACGEDMVEIILDPGRVAKGPEDLYHIIVKPNGVILTEKGVHTDPPLGKAQAWPVAASVSVKQSSDLWTVEIAIPLEAFGDQGKAALWGINFTRFATQGGEASSWSGAPRYFYDPRNLGTMFIVRPGDAATTATATTASD